MVTQYKMKKIQQFYSSDSSVVFFVSFKISVILQFVKSY